VSEEEDEVTAEPIVTEQQETIEESTPEEVEPKEDILPIVSQETIEQEMVEEPIVEPIVEAEPIVEPEPVVTPQPIVEVQEEEKEEVPEVIEKPIVKETKTYSYPTQTTLFGSSVDDIRQAISLGDRFLFQRELFGGNGELMQKTLDILNQKHDFDDALAYINKNFDWNQDSSTYELFINVLHRRF
jgi:hypothetical protein